MAQTTPQNLPTAAIEHYRTQGFVKIPGIISPEEAAEFRAAALDYAAAQPKYSDRPIFDQFVNVWLRNPVMERLTLHPNLTALAAKLAGVPLRLWHDQILIKRPHNNAATEFHQDQPYWSHQPMDWCPAPISAWIALCDVPPEKGCMTFIPGTHRLTDLPAQNLGDSKSLFSLAPQLAWEPRMTLPLKAGDCTFHHGRCAHMATPNQTDDPRVAHVVIFMHAATRYSGSRHVCTDPLGLKPGDPLDQHIFPVAGVGH